MTGSSSLDKLFISRFRLLSKKATWPPEGGRSSGERGSVGAATWVAFSMAVVTGGGAAGYGGEQVLTAPGGPGRLPPGLLGNESLPGGL